MNLIFALFSLFSFFHTGNASPFEYDIHQIFIPGTNSRTMVCFHGYGSNYTRAEKLQGLTDANLISFNFPDYDIVKRAHAHKVSFGTIQELLPAFYVLKENVIDKQMDTIDLYGHSAGGGAIINLIAVLNTSKYDLELRDLGITDQGKKLLLTAIQNGIVILDTPLKSVEEIIRFRGSSLELELLAKQYRDHHFRPIDAIDSLVGLSLNLIVHFQEPDEILSNHDDQLFIEKLQKVNRKGTTSVIIADDGGHIAPHHSLWKYYSKKLNPID